MVLTGMTLNKYCESSFKCVAIRGKITAINATSFCEAVLDAFASAII